MQLYGTYLSGQTNGFSDALSLPAVAAVFDIVGVEPAERPETARKLLLIHRAVVEAAELRRRVPRG